MRECTSILRVFYLTLESMRGKGLATPSKLAANLEIFTSPQMTFQFPVLLSKNVSILSSQISSPLILVLAGLNDFYSQ